jgi:hypothetical protein
MQSIRIIYQHLLYARRLLLNLLVISRVPLYLYCKRRRYRHIIWVVILLDGSRVDLASDLL